MNTLTILLSVFLSLLYSVSGYPTTNYPEKQALRYGFQHTHECKSFEKSFLCVRKCLDKNYDIAVSDKNCKCTCYSKKDKAKYKQKNGNATKWVGGAPSTHLPRWYQTTGINVKSGEDSGENTESIVSNDENGASDTGGKAEPGVTAKTGELATGDAEKGHTGETTKKDEAAYKGETEAPPKGETNQAEKKQVDVEGVTGPAAEGKTEADQKAETAAVGEKEPPPAE